MSLAVSAVVVAERRQARCATHIHSGSRHVPIPGASGDPADFGCSLLQPATATEIGLDLLAFLATLAAARSLAIALRAARLRRLVEFPPDEPPAPRDYNPFRPGGRHRTPRG